MSASGFTTQGLQPVGVVWEPINNHALPCITRCHCISLHFPTWALHLTTLTLYLTTLTLQLTTLTLHLTTLTLHHTTLTLNLTPWHCISPPDTASPILTLYLTSSVSSILVPQLLTPSADTTDTTACTAVLISLPHSVVLTRWESVWDWGPQQTVLCTHCTAVHNTKHCCTDVTNTKDFTSILMIAPGDRYQYPAEDQLWYRYRYTKFNTNTMVKLG